MRLFTLFTRQAPNRVFLSIVLSIAAGLSNALLIPIILSSLSYGSDELEAGTQATRSVLGMEVSHYKFALLFLAVCLLVLITRSTSRVLLKRVVLEAATELRVDTYRRIMRTAVAELEKLGPSKLLATITVDVNRVAVGARSAPDLMVSSITLTGILTYLFFLNVEVFRFVLAATLFGALTHQIPSIIGRRYLGLARARFDDLHECIRGLIYGTKELRLSKVKRERYLNEILLVDERAVLDHDRRGHTIMTLAAAYGELLGFFLIGGTAYVFVSYHAIGNAELIAVIVVLMYVIGPVNAILSTIPNITAASISLRNMERVFAKLSEEQAREEIKPLDQWDALRLSKVSYSYETPDGRFDLGPIDLELRKGETTFIVGGNGSGKSTLCKLLAFHYWPDAGQIHLGNLEVDRRSINSCRQAVGAILTDYYLFDRLLVDLSADDELLVQQYLGELGLHQAVSIENGSFSRTSLSDGQRKRLALLTVLIEDREIYIFDEWAENQDPGFKEIFYQKIVPELRARGKVVVIVSHDDRYFHVADQLIVLERGQLVRPVDRRRASR